MNSQSALPAVKTSSARFLRTLLFPHPPTGASGIAFTTPLFFLLFLLCAIPSPSTVYAKSLQEQIHVVDKKTVDRLAPGKPVRFRIRVVPVPSRKKPVHLHIYLDNRMLQMLTLTHSVTTIHLPPLAPGKHSVVFIEANPLTHQPMEGNGDDEMSGMSSDMHAMDMGGSSKMKMMSDNLTDIPARFRLKTLTLIVLPR